MKKCLLLAYIMSFFLNSKSFSEDIIYKNLLMTYSLPFSDYKLIHQEKNNIKVSIVKFPQVVSKKHNKYIIPNFSIILEDIPKYITVENYIASKIVRIQSNPGFNKNPNRDDIIVDKLPNSIDFYYEYTDKNEIEHSCYVLCKICNEVGLCIIFDCTSDIYINQRSILEMVIKSIRIKEN